MPRRVARSSRSHDALGGGAVTVVAGSIRTADDPTALDVKLSIWETEITMRADGAELGHWPAAAVSIRPLDAFSFEFVAEGDHLIFQPRDPDDFRNHPIVAGTNGTKRRKKRSKAKPPPPPAKELRWDESTAAEAKVIKRAADPTQKETRRDRKAAKAAAKEAVAKAVAARKVKVPVTDYDRPSQTKKRKSAPAPPADTEPTTPASVVTEPVAAVVQESTQHSSSQAVAEPVASPATTNGAGAHHGESGFAALRHKAWMASLDLARRYDLLGLDRVPVNEGLRGAEHAHTWDHRVAPRSGPGSFICTVCGAIRRRS